MLLLWYIVLSLTTHDNSVQSTGLTATAIKDHQCTNWPHSSPCLSFKKADVVHIISKEEESDIWLGELSGIKGYFDSNFVNLDFQRVDNRDHSSNAEHSFPVKRDETPDSVMSRLKQAYHKGKTTGKLSSLTMVTIFYGISIAVLFHVYSRKRMLDEYEASLCSRYQRLEDELRNESDQSSLNDSFKAELDAAVLSERMCVGKLREYEARLKEKVLEAEESESKLQKALEEIDQLRLKLTEYEHETVKMNEKSEMTEYQRMRETDVLKQRIDESNRLREELEMKVTKMTAHWESLQPLLDETGCLLDQMNKFSLTRIDSFLLDPLDTEFSDFIRKLDEFKSHHHVESFKQAVQKAEEEAELHARNTKAQLREKEEAISDARDQITELGKQLEILKVRLDTVEAMRQKDLTNSTKEISELRQQLESTLSENKKLMETSSEASSLWHKVSVLKEENESLRKEFTKLSEEKKELLNCLERKTAEFSLEKDNLLNMNETLRRKVIEKEHSLLRISSPASQESVHRFTPNSLPPQPSPSQGVAASNVPSWQSYNGGTFGNLTPAVAPTGNTPVTNEYRSASVPPPNGTSPTQFNEGQRYAAPQQQMNPQDMLRAQFIYQMQQQQRAAWYQDPHLQRPIPNRFVGSQQMMWQPFMWPSNVYPQAEEDGEEESSGEDEEE